MILKESFQKSNDGNLVCKHPISKLLDFLNAVYFLNEVCTSTSSSNLKAGQEFPEQALKILFTASKNDHYANIVNAMLEAGTYVYGSDEDQSTALHYAAMSGSIRVMSILLEHKASVHCLNIRRESYFLVACKNSRWEAARMLFENGADPFYSDSDQCNPISVGISSHAVDLLQYMAAKNPAVLKDLQRKISLADAVVFRYNILKHDLRNLNDKKITDIVKLACVHGNTDIIRQFSKKLSDQALVLHIEEACNAEQYGCVNELLMQCKTRHGFPCPQISLSDSCKSDQLIDLTRLLTEYGKDVNEHSGQPLQTAVEKDNRRAVQYLIDNGADINKNDENHETPLMHACKESNLFIVDMLLINGANINCGLCETPLTICCFKENVSVLKRLLSNEPPPDISATNKDYMTPLEIAKGTCLLEIVLHLLHREGSLSSENVSFNQVFQVGRHDLVESFLKNCSDCQPVDEESINFVVKTNNLSLMKIILDVDKVTKSPSVLKHAFKSACTIGSSKMVELLIQFDSSITMKCIDETGNSNLHQAILHQRADIVRLLIDRGYDPKQEHVPVEEAIKSKQVLKILLERGLPQVSINKALMFVCKGGHDNAESCVGLLLDKAANVNYQDMDDPDRLTPLLAATLNSSTTLVKILLSRDANPNIADENHRTPLFVACMLERYELASLLLYNEGVGGRAHSYLPYLPSDKYPIWVSCMNGYLDLVLLLLYGGVHNQADHNCTQKIHDDLIQAAHDAGQHEAVRLLLEFGTNPEALHNVSLLEACRLGYVEHALSIFHKVSTEELC